MVSTVGKFIASLKPHIHTRTKLSEMETLTTTAGAVSLPIFSPNKSKDASSRRIVRFSTSPKNSNSNGNNNSEHDLKFDSTDSSSLVPMLRNHTLSQDAAMGLVLSAANVRGWTTGSGMEGPQSPAGQGSDSGTTQVSTFPWSLFTKSPRRRMRVAFTCNVCGQRTTRAINPHAYTDGTVFVQCCGCNIFHKLVDNLNLFHEMKCYVNSSFNPNPNDNMSFKYFDDLDKEDNND
ncbi:dnl-type zinc finger protein [Phtheirospermum japonicum]|uniref:Dnl-type zinc finger protein n=1 Tax=Phtheirospermum japonicum TaxID=374723 RepID=A0A830CBU2_9LAMI|nr:dnl-type zinc finger protein [Phtheirospermum japonicum]